MKNSILFFCVLLLMSCSGIYRFTIEVQEPAPVTLPPHVVNVLVVNNSAPQPGNAGVNRTFQGIPVEGMQLNLDSTANIATISLASHLQKSRFFDRVLTSPVSLRNDSNWMETEALPDSFKIEAFETHGFDGIISIDRFLVQFDQHVTNAFHYANFRIYGSAICGIHIYGRTSPPAKFMVSDSLLYDALIEGDRVEIFKKFPESFIEYFASTIGERLGQQIIPGWYEKERYLYAGSQSRMYEALRFAQKSNWIHAIRLWENEYERAVQPQAKGRLTFNLAVAYEMLYQCGTALHWATIAKNHFRETGQPPASAENARIDAYITDLQKRIRDNYLLDLQWGVSNDSSEKRE